jgi:hypothetical protein
MKKRMTKRTTTKAPAPGKPINIHNVDRELWDRFRNAIRVRKKTTAAYLEEAISEKLERDGF